MKEGSLSSVTKGTIRISSNLKIQILTNICQGMHYLHSRNLIHRDLKPENVLLENFSLGKVKICDFGISTKLSKKLKTVTINSEDEVAFGTLLKFVKKKKKKKS